MWIGRMVAGDTDKTRPSGTVAYIVLEGGQTHSMDGATVYAETTSSAKVPGIGDSPNSASEGVSAPSGSDVAVTTQAGMIGGDGSWALSRSVSASSVSISVDEDTIGDPERRHIDERVSELCFVVLSGCVMVSHWLVSVAGRDRRRCGNGYRRRKRWRG